MYMPSERTDDAAGAGSSAAPQAADAMPAISVRGLAKRFGAHGVLEGVSVDIAHGEMLVVLGPSGSGKTTLLRIIAGLVEPDAGEVLLRGRSAVGMRPQERRLGVVFQEQALFQRMTVEENIAFGLRLRKAPDARVRETVREMLELTRLGDHRGKLPSQLSGGQRQRVAVARALAFRPDAMLFDEPFSALDAVTRAELRREVRVMLRAVNMPALFITHDQEEALELADRVAVLNQGRIEQVGTPFDVYNHPSSEFVATFLGAANVLLGRWWAGEVSVGSVRLKPPATHPPLAENQAVKVVFRPEDLALNFQAQLLDTPHYLGPAVVEDVSYVGPTERLAVRVMLWSRPTGRLEPGADGLPIVVTRTKWEATEMELSVGDQVVVGLKDYRLLPHYPLRAESGAKVYDA
jgi:sulfate transport system ATP-binding protein